MAQEGGHWYKRDGTPYYTKKGANGKVRNVTLRDVRKEGDIVPSFTGIANMQAKPFLVEYFRKQVIDACWNADPALLQGDFEEYDRVVRELAEEHANEARDIGTKLHGKLDDYFSGKLEESDDDYEMCASVARYIMQLLGSLDDIDAERSFAHRLGYGGKVDISRKTGIPFVADFKFKVWRDGAPIRNLVWRDQGMQLIAYKRGLDLPNEARCINIYIHRDTHEIRHYEWSLEEQVSCWRQFTALLEVWKCEKGLDPSW